MPEMRNHAGNLHMRPRRTSNITGGPETSGGSGREKRQEGAGMALHRNLTLAHVLLALALSALCAGAARADTIYLANGGKLEGTIIKEEPDKVTIKTKYGTQTIDRMDIDRVDASKSERELYEEKKAQIEDNDAEGFYRLGLWCKENGLEQQAEAEMERVLEIDPDHDGARAELGYQKYEGEWLTEDEVMEKKGFRKWQGEWVESQEYDRRMKEKIRLDKEKEEREAAKLAEEVKKATEAAMKEYEGVPWDQAHQKDTDHFHIVCNSTVEIMEKYAWLMERLYDKYQKVFAAFEPDKRKCNIYIHRNHQEFMQMRRKPAGVGGFYMPGQYQLVAFHGMFGGTGDTTTVLAHEGTHLFQDLIGMFGTPTRSPIWLIEGLAVVMEAADINWRSGKISIKGVSRDRLVALQSELQGKGGMQAMTIQQVMNTPHSGFSGRHYAYAGMFTYWLLDGATAKHVQVYNDYVRIATGGPNNQPRPRQIQADDFQKLLDKYLKCTVDDLEKIWIKWVLKQKPEQLVFKRGNSFVSKELGFSVTRPSTKWKGGLDDLQSGEMVAFTNKELEARIYITAGGNFMNYTVESLVDALKKSYSEAETKGAITDYKLVSEKFDTVKGHRVYDMVILAKNPKSEISTELMKRRYVYFITPDNVYSVRLMAPPDKYDECLMDFANTLEGFEIDL
jgi:tetratricopeptide (TPR) repeat protein